MMVEILDMMDNSNLYRYLLELSTLLIPFLTFSFV